VSTCNIPKYKILENEAEKSAKLSRRNNLITYHGTDDGDSICKHVLTKELRQSIISARVKEV